MNGKDLLRAMQEIDSAYVAEAAESGPQKRRMPLWGWLTTAAACAVIIFAVGLTLRPKAPEPVAASVRIDLKDLTVNEAYGFMLSTNYQGEPVTLAPNSQEVLDHFGKDPTPKYIPDYLIPSPENFLCAENAGQLCFYTGFDENGEAVLWEDSALAKGFTLYVEDVETSDFNFDYNGGRSTNIGGVPMTISHAYPAGGLERTDLYEFRFILDGLDYTLLSTQMPLADVVKVIVSIIYDTADVTVVDTRTPNATMPPAQDPNTGEDTLAVYMDDVLVNENCAICSLDYALDLNKLFPLTWEEDDVEAYFGWNLQPGYVKDITPELELDDNELRFQVYAGASGDIQWDTVPISWSEPILPSVEYAHRRGFTLTASRLGIFCEDFGVFADAELTRGLPEEDIQVTDIGGTGVIFGHINYGYGPYDSGTQEPTGYYDIYMAKFSVNGVEYRIIAHDLSLRDVVILTTDVIWHNTEGYRDYSVTD